MFALILAMAFNPATGQTTWAVGPTGFVNEKSCVVYAESDAGQKFMRKVGALAFNCDQLKEVK